MIDEAWVASLETNLDLAERLEASIPRFGRLQYITGEKLLPRMMALAVNNADQAAIGLLNTEALIRSPVARLNSV
jgi:hypothetical protein